MLPAQMLPYMEALAYLLAGGPKALFEAITGIAAGFIWYVLCDLPRTGQVSRTHQRLARIVAPVFTTPTFLRRLLAPRGLQRTSFGYAGRSMGRSTGTVPWFSRGTSVGGSTSSTSRPDRAAMAAAAEARMRK